MDKLTDAIVVTNSTLVSNLILEVKKLEKQIQSLEHHMRVNDGLMFEKIDRVEKWSMRWVIRKAYRWIRNQKRLPIKGSVKA